MLSLSKIRGTNKQLELVRLYQSGDVTTHHGNLHNLQGFAIATLLVKMLGILKVEICMVYFILSFLVSLACIVRPTDI